MAGIAPESRQKKTFFRPYAVAQEHKSISPKLGLLNTVAYPFPIASTSSGRDVARGLPSLDSRAVEPHSLLHIRR
jgi:hypothetical protein